MRKIEKITDLGDMCAVKWRMTYVCNYSCPYCLQKKDAGSLAEDSRRCAAAAPEVSRIISELGRRARKGVLLELIGGECTLLDLDSVLSEITSPFLKRVNITSNFSKGADYFLSLYKKLKKRNIELMPTCSLHTSNTTLEKYESEVLKFKSGAPDCVFKCESVTYDDTPDDAAEGEKPEEKEADPSDELYNFCLENGIACIIDRDLTGLPDKEAKQCNKKPRYRITFDDGTEKELLGRSPLITGQDKDTSYLAVGNGIVPRGYYCTRDYDYVYVHFDKHMGFCRNGEHFCKSLEPLAGFHVLDKPAMCDKPRCSLCGRMSIAKTTDGISVKVR